MDHLVLLQFKVSSMLRQWEFFKRIKIFLTLLIPKSISDIYNYESDGRITKKPENSGFFVYVMLMLQSDYGH